MVENDNELVESEQLISGRLYTSGEVAKMFNISRDMIRYYTNEFSEFIKPEKTKDGKGGHLRYNDDDISNLQMIMNLLKTYTPQEVKSKLNDPNTKIILQNTGDVDSKFIKLLLENNQYLLTMIKNFLNDTNSQRDAIETNLLSKQLEENKRMYDALVLENKEMKEMLKETMQKLDEMNKKPDKGFLRWLRK